MTQRLVARGVVRAGNGDVAEAVVDGVEVVELAVVALGHGVEHGDGLFGFGGPGGNAGGAAVEVGLVAALPELAVAVDVVLQLHLAIDHLDHALLHEGIGAGLVAVGAGLTDGIHVAGVGQPPCVGGQRFGLCCVSCVVSLLMQYAAARGLCASPSFEALRQAQGERVRLLPPSSALRTGPSCALRTGPSSALRTGPSCSLRTGSGRTGNGPRSTWGHVRAYGARRLAPAGGMVNGAPYTSPHQTVL